MKKEKKAAKIALNRETLRTLTSSELREPAGGVTAGSSCDDTCLCSRVRTCSCMSTCC
jgi:hypothetical protein